MKIKILSWNVRGVNNPEKRKVIKQFIRDQRVDLVCLQETKVQNMNLQMARSLGAGRFSQWVSVDASGSAGGILLMWDKRILEVNETVRDFYCLLLFPKCGGWISMDLHRGLWSSFAQLKGRDVGGTEVNERFMSWSLVYWGRF